VTFFDYPAIGAKSTYFRIPSKTIHIAYKNELRVGLKIMELGTRDLEHL
jgi:hypothetical protein